MTPTTDSRITVWMAMAEHFLDTETRHDLPQTALTCVRAGLSIEEAHDVWCHEVCPAVGINRLNVAGEWAGWPEDWLVERIEEIRATRASLSRPLRWLCHQLDLVLTFDWSAIERCMEVLLAAPVDDRAGLARDLGLLARVYFDFDRIDCFAKLKPVDRERIFSLYPKPFRTLLAPVAWGEARSGDRRVRAALQLCAAR
jgi:hypothetical protein